MKYDNLGRIDIAHIALADKCIDSVFSNECIHLAKLHSIAVDYPKVQTTENIYNIYLYMSNIYIHLYILYIGIKLISCINILYM